MGFRKYLTPPVRECKNCGTEFPLNRKDGGGYTHNQVYCSGSCRNIARNTGHIDRHGYRRVSVYGRGVFQEHRLVMERSIGRPLFEHETVHHRNGNRSDNRIENLELWSSRHGKGQRVGDKLDFARSLLSEYGVAFVQPRSDEFALGALSIGA